MAGHVASKFSFTFGFVESRDVFRMISQSDDLNRAGVANSSSDKWLRSDPSWSGFPLDWVAIRLLTAGPSKDLFMLGVQGRVGVGTDEGETDEQIDPSAHGIGGHGPLRDLKEIGKHVYAAGMGRQVYRRDGPGKWVHRDSGILRSSDPKSIVGFNSIDGLGEDDLYAAGFGGEIWRCVKNKWKEIDSPTNVVLNKIRAVREDLIFACGQKGTLLRGHGATWEPVAAGTTDEEFWDLEWFGNALYVATDEVLYRLEADDTLVPVDVKLRNATFASLHSADGVLLSVGRKHVLCTEDGVHWTDLDVRPPAKQKK